MNTPIIRLKWAYPEQEVYLYHQDALILSPSKRIKLQAFLQDSPIQAIITCGGVHSHHALAVAYEAIQRNLRCYLFLRGRPLTRPLGPHLLLRLLAPHIYYLSEKEYALSKETRMQTLADALAQENVIAKIIPEGALTVPEGNNPFVSEILQNIYAYEQTQGFRFDRILVALGTGGTYLHFLKASLNASIQAKWTGVPALATAEYFIQKWHELGIESPWEFWKTPSFRAFGKLDPEVAKTVQRIACKEGVLLDPLYDGKVAHTLEYYFQQGKYTQEKILLWHTGGIFDIFSLKWTFEETSEFTS